VQVKGNLQLMKEINTAMILNLLHREGRLTRAELKKITKLSATTVSALIEELIEQNYVKEVGEKYAEGAGRRAISLQINRDGGYVIGLFFWQPISDLCCHESAWADHRRIPDRHCHW
jgi:N-acetylglucosamine repressor